MGRSRHSVSSRAGHMTTETVYGQMLALRLRGGDEHRTLESDTTELNVKGNLYLYFFCLSETPGDLKVEFNVQLKLLLYLINGSSVCKKCNGLCYVTSSSYS